MNLASVSADNHKLRFVPFVSTMVREEGILSLYNGLPAGLIRQVALSSRSTLQFTLMISH
jgi:lantibiotic modifying enzyme